MTEPIVMLCPLPIDTPLGFGEELDVAEINGMEIDCREFGGKEIDDREIDGREIDDVDIDGVEIASEDVSSKAELAEIVKEVKRSSDPCVVVAAGPVRLLIDGASEKPDGSPIMMESE